MIIPLKQAGKPAVRQTGMSALQFQVSGFAIAMNYSPSYNPKIHRSPKKRKLFFTFLVRYPDSLRINILKGDFILWFAPADGLGSGERAVA